MCSLQCCVRFYIHGVFLKQTEQAINFNLLLSNHTVQLRSVIYNFTYMIYTLYHSTAEFTNLIGQEVLINLL